MSRLTWRDTGRARVVMLMLLRRVRIEGMRRPVPRWRRLRKLMSVAKSGRRRIRRRRTILSVVVRSVVVVVLSAAFLRVHAVFSAGKGLRMTGREAGGGRVIAMTVVRSGVERVKLVRRHREILHLVHLSVDAGSREGS